MVVGYEVGNDYDIGARLLARYLSKELPGNPTIVVQNMPQASGVVAANYMALKAAKDGSVIGGISRNLPSQAMMKLPNIEADPRKFIWLGATSFPGRVCVAVDRRAGEDRGRPVQDRPAHRRGRRRLLHRHRADGASTACSARASRWSRAIAAPATS